MYNVATCVIILIVGIILIYAGYVRGGMATFYIGALLAIVAFIELLFMLFAGSDSIVMSTILLWIIAFGIIFGAAFIAATEAWPVRVDTYHARYGMPEGYFGTYTKL